MDIAGKLPSSAGYKLPSGLDVDQAKTYGSLVTYRCRIQQKVQRVRTTDGDEVTSMHTVFGSVTLPLDALFFFPGNDGSTLGDGFRVLSTGQSSSIDGSETLHKAFL